MDALGHERFAVVGHDTGYIISYALAADHPHRVDRVALAEIPGPPVVVSSPPLFVPEPVNNRVWHIPFNRVNDELTEPLVRGREEIVVTVIASALVLVVAAATALGQTRSSDEPSGSAQAPQSAAVAGAAIAEPAWCCATGSIPGITVTGQATIKDESTAARDAAIAEAVADATDQAKVAADAAGTQLGEVLDMQVSAMPVVYPMIEAAPQPGVAVGSGSSSRRSRPGSNRSRRTCSIPGLGHGNDHLGDRVARAGAAKRQRLFEPRGRNAVVVTCATVTIPFARDPRADRGIGVATGLRTTRRAESTRVDPTSKWRWCLVQGGDTLQHAVDPVSIPHDVGN